MVAVRIRLSNLKSKPNSDYKVNNLLYKLWSDSVKFAQLVTGIPISNKSSIYVILPSWYTEHDDVILKSFDPKTIQNLTVSYFSGYALN